MKKSIIIVVLFLVSIATANAAKEDYLKLISNTGYCHNCETVYEFTKATELTAELADIRLDFYDRNRGNAISKVERLKYQYMADVPYQYSIPAYSISSECSINENTSKSECHNVSEMVGYDTKTAYIKQWQDTTLPALKEKFLNAKTGDKVKFKVEGKISLGEWVDNVVSVAGYSYDEYAIWDGTRIFEGFSSTNDINLSKTSSVKINTTYGYAVLDFSNLYDDYNSTSYFGAFDDGDYWTINGTSGSTVVNNTQLGSKGWSNLFGSAANHKYSNVHSFNGQYGLQLVNSANDEAVYYTIPSLEGVWEFLFYDDMSTDVGGQWYAMMRDVSNLESSVGYDRGASTTQYLYYDGTNHVFGTRSLGWHHFKFRRGSSYVEIYKDGVLVNNDTSVSYSFTNLRFYAYKIAPYFDLVRIYNNTHPPYAANFTITSGVFDANMSTSSATCILNYTTAQWGTVGCYIKKPSDSSWTYLPNGTSTSFTLLAGTDFKYKINGTRLNPATQGRIYSVEITFEGAGSASESEGDAAIEAGIAGAGIETVYSNQQIYIRALNGTQQLGTFDKAAATSNKRWAFNYVTGSESFTYMLNLTPVLYVLELANKDTQAITEAVGNLINSTK